MVAFIKNFLVKRKYGILANKFLVRILLFSSFITLILTSIQLYMEYNNDYGVIDKKLNEIQRSTLNSLARSVWVLNKDQIELQLNGILEIPDIEYVELNTDVGDIYKNGSIKNTNNFVLKKYKINFNDGKDHNLGELKVYATLDNIHNKLRNKFLFILLSQTAKTFIVSFFILWMFYHLIGRHLNRIAAFTENFSIKSLDGEIKLNRAKNENQDEIDKIVEAIYAMRNTIRADIKEKEDLESKLLQKQKMESLGTLASGISHDFNNILQGVFNSLELLRQDLQDSPKQIEQLDMAGKFAERGRDLVHKILSFCRKDQSDYAPLKLNDVLADSVNMLNATVTTNVIIECNLPKEDFIINSDPVTLHQVFINIGINAFHAMGEAGGRLVISVSKEDILRDSKLLDAGQYVMVKISDTGPGISNNIKNKLFEPFFTTKEVGKGTGMGLSVVHGIMKNHNGLVYVESELGKGSTFTLYFPIQNEVKIKSFSEKEGFFSDNQKVLLLDDENEIIDLIASSLNNLGHDAVSFSVIQDAIDYLQSNEVDVIVTDYNMPEMNGDEFAETIKKLGIDVPIILATGFLTNEIEKTDLFTSILKKPYTKEQLLFAIKNKSRPKAA